jgi:hypothetical protein
MNDPLYSDHSAEFIAKGSTVAFSFCRMKVGCKENKRLRVWRLSPPMRP